MKKGDMKVLKPGDKVLCKSEMSGYYKNEVEVYFDAGKFYIVSDIYIYHQKGYGLEYYIFDNTGYRIAFGVKYNTGKGYHLFHNYFYTEKEMRKIKLERLEIVSNSKEVI